ncbi:MAG: hypothetical protein MHPSP_002179 [Paramarteilia canceri]
MDRREKKFRPAFLPDLRDKKGNVILSSQYRLVYILDKERGSEDYSGGSFVTRAKASFLRVLKTVFCIGQGAALLVADGAQNGFRIISDSDIWFDPEADGLSRFNVETHSRLKEVSYGIHLIE